MIQKVLSGILTIAMVSQTAFASRPETNFWAERHALTANKTGAATPVQMASLAMPLSAPFTQNISALPQRPASSVSLSRNAAQPFRDITSRISPFNATVQDIYDNGGERKDPPIIIVQDVHMNAEAQTNISAVLQSLLDDNRIGSVGVEGAFDRFDFAPLRTFPDKKIRDRVAKSFLDAAKLAAPSYVGITDSVEPPLFIGVDDRPRYWANVQAYLDSRPIKEKTLQDLQTLQRTLRDRKQTVFSAELRQFDALRASYQAGALGLGAYAEKLTGLVGEENIPPALSRFVKAIRLEKNLNFTLIDQQRKRVFDKLTRALDERETQRLISDSMAYREGKIGFGDYYQSFQALCARRGVDLRETPLFDSYIRYVLLTDGISAEKLFSALDVVERSAVVKLAVTEEQRNLLEQSEALSLAGKLVEFDLTAAEWERYQRLPRPLKNLSTFEAFYINADARSEKMTQNLAKCATTVGRSTVLVVGGFHTPAIAQKLREQKTSYLIVSPKITKIDAAGGSAYLSVFEREKTPIDKLFRAERLFINPTIDNITDPELMNDLLAEMTHELPSGGRILRLRALFKKAGVSETSYDGHLETIENGLSITAGALLTAFVAKMFGLPLSTFWTNPALMFAVASAAGWLLFVVAHNPRFSSGLAPPKTLELNLAYAALIAVENAVISAVPLLVTIIFPHAHFIATPILIFISLVLGVARHKSINERAAAQLAHRAMVHDAVQFHQKRKLELIFDFLQEADIRQIHQELWNLSPAYERYFKEHGSSDLPAIKKIWLDIFLQETPQPAGVEFVLKPGERIGTFTIESLLVPLISGGFGAVYKAHDDLGNNAILKTMKAEANTRLGHLIFSLATLRNEAKILELLTSVPGENDIAPRFIKSGFESGHYYLAMTAVPGESLYNIVQKKSREKNVNANGRVLTPYNIAELYGLLAELHRRGVVHGDLKPGNIMVLNPDDPNHDKRKFMFIDFGISKLISQRGSAFVDYLGTEHYIAPTKWSAGSSPGTDMFSMRQIAKDLIVSSLITPHIRTVLDESVYLTQDDTKNLAQKWRQATKTIPDADRPGPIAKLENTGAIFYDSKPLVMESTDQTKRTYAPLWEWIFQIPLAIGLYGGFDTLHIVAIAALSAALFGLSHRSAKPWQRLFLVGLNFVAFSGAFIFPWMLFGASHSALTEGLVLSMLIHDAYNRRVLALRASVDEGRRKLGNMLPLASISSTRNKRGKSLEYFPQTPPSPRLPDVLETIFETVPDKDMEEIHRELKQHSPTYKRLVDLDHQTEDIPYIKKLWKTVFDFDSELTSGSSNVWGQKTSIEKNLLTTRLGVGGFGTAYEATDVDERTVVVKMANFTRSDDSSDHSSAPARTRTRHDKSLPLKQIILSLLALRSEGNILQSIQDNQDNRKKDIAPKIYERGMTKRNKNKMSNRFYLSMERIPGEPLSKAGIGSLTLNNALELFRMLERLHSIGVVHGDIKPDNIMVLTKPDGTKSFRLIDFGSAKRVDQPAQVTDYFLSPNYASLERIQNGSSQASDVFALATMIRKSSLLSQLAHTPAYDVLLKAATETPIDGTVLPPRHTAAGIVKILQKSIQSIEEKNRAFSAAPIYMGETKAPADLDATGAWGEFQNAAMQPGALWRPAAFRKNALMLRIWEFLLSPVWEEAVFTLLPLATGHVWVFFAGRIVFVALHWMSKKPGALNVPTMISLFVGLIVGAQTGFDFFNLTWPLMLKIYAGAIAAHAGFNAMASENRHARYRQIADALIARALAPDAGTAADLLTVLTTENPGSIEGAFAPRAKSSAFNFNDAVLMNDPAFSTILRDAVRRESRKSKLTPDQMATVVQQLAWMGIEAKTLDAISDALLDDTTHIQVLLEGSDASLEKDAEKLNSIIAFADRARSKKIDIQVLLENPLGNPALARKFANRNVAFATRPADAMKEGVLYLDRLKPAAELKGTMFFVSIPSVARVDLSADLTAMSAADKDELLKSLQVAFIDEMLRVRVLNGMSVNNLDAIAREILSAA